MSTSIKNLAPYEIVFKRPAIALGFIVAVAAMLLNPGYNFMPVMAGVILYFILYQNRKMIYKFGIDRFHFLSFLVYSTVLVSRPCSSMDRTADF